MLLRGISELLFVTILDYQTNSTYATTEDLAVRTRPAKSPRLKIMAILSSDPRCKATTGSVAHTSQDERHRGMPLFLESPEVQIRTLIACETHESLKR